MLTQLKSVSSPTELDVQEGFSVDKINCNSVCHITYNRDSWVKLYQCPSAYAEEEALLLCEQSSGVWVSWIPNHGEALLDKSEFYC
ncbi:MAG: hypothetical protein IGQ45_00855 [Cyanobacterium sp. T60_A2020_053]|nr:hypothetical protein [Cyanobacterium sp. T60_A2020_053]